MTYWKVLAFPLSREGFRKTYFGWLMLALVSTAFVLFDDYKSLAELWTVMLIVYCIISYGLYRELRKWDRLFDMIREKVERAVNSRRR